MNDFDYDSLQKKRIAQNARYKKRCGGKYVSLPSDNLTAAQRRKLNGGVFTMNINEPMGWEEFKALPQTMRKTYIENLREKYGASDDQIGRLFGKSGVTIMKTRETLGIPAFPKSQRQTQVQKMEWRDFMSKQSGGMSSDELTEWCKTAPQAEEKDPDTSPELTGSIRIELNVTLESFSDVIRAIETLKQFPKGTRFKVEFGNGDEE